MMMPDSQTTKPRLHSSGTLRPRLPALRHAGRFARCSGSSCVVWLPLAVFILVVSGGTSALPATAVEGHETPEADLGALLDAGDGAVLTLVAGNTRLAVHRAVLAARSQVFAEMFAHDPLETSRHEYVILDVEGPELRNLVAFMYSGRAPQLPGMTPQLLEAATKYGVSGLRDAFEQQLARHLTVDNVAAKAVLAVAHNYSTLRQAAVDFIRDHGFQVMATPGWAEAVRSHPEAVVEFTRLLVNPPTETSVLAVFNHMSPRERAHHNMPYTSVCSPLATVTSEATPTTQSNSDDGQTSAAVTPSSARPHTPIRDNASVSQFRDPATAGSEATPTTWPHSNDGRTPAAATAKQFPTCPGTAPLDEAAVSRLWMLSDKEKSRRLLLAVNKGAVQEMMALLAAGADVEARGGDERGALYQAARQGHVVAVQCLLQAGAAVDARDLSQFTPLHAAAYWGHTAVVRLLLAASADPNSRDTWGRTPLHWAAERGQAEAATALLAVGADKSAWDNDGKTPMDLASR